MSSERNSSGKSQQKMKEADIFNAIFDDAQFFNRCERLWNELVKQDQTASVHRAVSTVQLDRGLRLYSKDNKDAPKEFIYPPANNTSTMTARISRFLLLHDKTGDMEGDIVDIALDVSKIKDKDEKEQEEELLIYLKNSYEYWEGISVNMPKLLGYVLIKIGYTFTDSPEINSTTVSTPKKSA